MNDNKYDQQLGQWKADAEQLKTDLAARQTDVQLNEVPIRLPDTNSPDAQALVEAMKKMDKDKTAIRDNKTKHVDDFFRRQAGL